MNQHLPSNGKPIKALGSSFPYDLIYTTDAKEAREFNRKNKGIRKLTRMLVMNQNGRVCWMPYSKIVIRVGKFYLPLDNRNYKGKPYIELTESRKG